MSTPSSDKAFAGSIPQFYETFLVPLIFEPYAADLAVRVAAEAPSRVLEIAAGTGVVTRAMASVLPESAAIVATDLNQPMLDHAASLASSRPVLWQQADAMALPFSDETFDAVVCQFGAMFFPDKAAAYREARRVLKNNGVFLFNVWDRIEENEFAEAVTSALATLFPADPPRFLARTPHGYHDVEAVRADLQRAGFHTAPAVTTLAARSRASSCTEPAIAYCQGTPLRTEILSRDPSLLDHATQVAAEAVAERFGKDAVDGKIQAHVLRVTK